MGASKDYATAFRAELLSRYKTSTAKKTIRYLSGVWQVCVDEEWTNSNPWKGVLKHVRDEVSIMRQGVPEGVWRTVSALPLRNQALFWLIAYSGMRIQEALGLRGKDLDWKAGLMHIASHQKRGLGNGIKNTNSIRSIPIDKRLERWADVLETNDELEEHRLRLKYKYHLQGLLLLRLPIKQTTLLQVFLISRELESKKRRGRTCDEVYSCIWIKLQVNERL